MRIIPDQLRSKNLVPFKKRHGRYKIPGMTSENEILMDRVDPDLSPEEQSYIRHYLGYADALIRGAEENALSEPREADSPKSSSSVEDSSAEEPLKHQKADQQAASLTGESSSAMNDLPARVA